MQLDRQKGSAVLYFFYLFIHRLFKTEIRVELFRVQLPAQILNLLIQYLRAFLENSDTDISFHISFCSAFTNQQRFKSRQTQTLLINQHKGIFRLNLIINFSSEDKCTQQLQATVNKQRLNVQIYVESTAAVGDRHEQFLTSCL